MERKKEPNKYWIKEEKLNWIKAVLNGESSL